MFNEQGAEVHFLPAPVPTRERMTAVLAQVATASGAEDDDQGLDPALATCLLEQARPLSIVRAVPLRLPGLAPAWHHSEARGGPASARARPWTAVAPFPRQKSRLERLGLAALNFLTMLR